MSRRHVLDTWNDADIRSVVGEVEVGVCDGGYSVGRDRRGRGGGLVQGRGWGRGLSSVVGLDKGVDKAGDAVETSGRILTASESVAAGCHKARASGWRCGNRDMQIGVEVCAGAVGGEGGTSEEVREVVDGGCRGRSARGISRAYYRRTIRKRGRVSRGAGRDAFWHVQAAVKGTIPRGECEEFEHDRRKWIIDMRG